MAKSIWVKFPAPVDQYPGAHRSLDGKVVGILLPPGVDILTRDPTPAKIQVVTKDKGHDLLALIDNKVIDVTVDPANTPYERCLVPDDCPVERVSHLIEGT